MRMCVYVCVSLLHRFIRPWLVLFSCLRSECTCTCCYILEVWSLRLLSSPRLCGLCPLPRLRLTRYLSLTVTASRFSLVCAFHNTVTVMTRFCYNYLLQLISVAAVSLSCGDIIKLLVFSVGQGKRLALLTGAAFCEGASLGTLVEAVLHFDPRYKWYQSL
jgi:hypothetical protein